MNNYFLNLVLDSQALLEIAGEAILADNKQSIDVILPDLSLIGYAVPVEGLGIVLFIFLFAIFLAEYNLRVYSQERFKIVINMHHAIHTPLALLRNKLYELKTASLPETISRKIEELVEYAESVMGCNQNVMALGMINEKVQFKPSLAILELTAYITSIVNQCRPFASSRQVRLSVNKRYLLIGTDAR